MSKPYDFKKEWEKTKKNILKVSKEAADIAQRGEKELLQFSKRSKYHLDSTAIRLKQEHFYYLIGKEYAKLKTPSRPTAKLKKLLEELKKVNAQQKTIKSKLKGGDRG